MTSPFHPLAVAGGLALLASTAAGGLDGTPLPTFGDGKPAVLAASIPMVVKNNDLETAVICTNLGPDPIDVGVEVFDQQGSLGNSIATGNGAALDVSVGATVTVATGSTALLHENVIISLEAPVTSLRHGAARVVATSTQVACVAFLVDDFHTIIDPALCPGCKPPTLTTLLTTSPCSPAACDDGSSCTTDDCSDTGGCTHTPVVDGTPCDDADACTTNDACGSGVCAGTAVTCDADTPCNLGARCDQTTGMCVDTAPFSTCTPGGGKKATDCSLEWVVENPGNAKGRTGRVQSCRQGDPTCDFDGDAGHCTFRIRLCLNNVDVDLPCQPTEIGTYKLKRPSSRSKKTTDRAASAMVLDAVSELGPSSRSGKRLERVVFDPPLSAGDRCTPVLSLAVPVRRALVFKAQTTAPGGPKDTDRLKLKCTSSTR